MKRRIYLVAIWLAAISVLLQIGFFLWLYGSVLLGTMIPIPSQGVLAFYVLGGFSLLEGLHVPLDPVLGQGLTGLIGGATGAILVLRRMLMWRRFGSASPPATYGSGGAVLLAICMTSLAVALVGLLAAPALRANYEIAYVFKLFGALLFPTLLALPAKYLFGVTLLVVELTSIGREGWWPRPGRSAVTAEPVGAAQPARRPVVARAGTLFASRRAITVAMVVIASMASIWGVFPTGLIHSHLCRTRAGAHVHERVRAPSYLFVGEGASGDGLHLYQAMEDVVDRRVQFIEVLKVPGNNHQRNAFGRFLGTHDPPGTVFRISIGAAGSPECLPAQNLRGMRVPLKAGECLQFVAVDRTASRYHVEAVNNQQATWLTPNIRSDGARVVDSERNVTLGEDLIFANTSLLAFVVLGERRMECPPRSGRRPAGLHRKVLLGDN